MSRRTMHRRGMLFALGLAAVALAGPARAQAPGEDDTPLKGEWAQGFWPTEKLMKNFIHRATLEIEERYDLREDQRDYLEASSIERWPTFLNKNRDKLMPLFTRYAELQTSPEPPTPEQMKDFGKDAQEMLDLFKEEIHEQQMDFREILDPEQKMTFDSEMMKFNVGMQAVETKVKNWQDGYFAPSDIGWKPTTQKQREQLAKAPKVKPPGEADPDNPDGGYVRNDGWDSWLEAFAQKYDIDDAQYRQANSILTDLKKRVSQHFTRNRREYARLEQVPADSRGADWQEQMNKLDEPIRGMFDELVQKCFALLTPEQREKGQTKGK